LYLIPRSGGAIRQISRDFDEDMMQYVWAQDSKSVYFTGSHGMDVNLFRATLDGKVTQVYTERGITRSISLAGNRMAFIHEAPSEPANAYLISLSEQVAPSSGDKHIVFGAQTTFTAKRITDLNSDVRHLT